jgi:hypothetical protein
VVGQPALMATRTLLSMNDFIGMSLAYRFSPNRKMSRTEQLLFGFFIDWRYSRSTQFSESVDYVSLTYNV